MTHAHVLMGNSPMLPRLSVMTEPEKALSSLTASDDRWATHRWHRHHSFARGSCSGHPLYDGIGRKGGREELRTGRAGKRPTRGS